MALLALEVYTFVLNNGVRTAQRASAAWRARLIFFYYLEDCTYGGGLYERLKYFPLRGEGRAGGVGRAHGHQPPRGLLRPAGAKS